MLIVFCLILMTVLTIKTSITVSALDSQTQCNLAPCALLHALGGL